MSTLDPNSIRRRPNINNNDDDFVEEDEDTYEKRHPRKIIKTVLMAIFLFITGSVSILSCIKKKKTIV